MALQSPFFGKRELDTPTARTLTPAQPVRTGAMPSAVAPAPSLTPAQEPPATDPHKPTRPGADSQLKVGPLIRLKGVEITDCDTLVVEGTVEATMDSRVIQISHNGAFKGSAEIDIAEIHGEFNGTLTVRQKLVIYSTGKVNGKIRYGKLVVEEGGQLAGEIEAGFSGASASRSTAAVQPVRAEPTAMAA